MQNRFDTEALLEQIKAIAMVPDSQALLSDDRMLRFASAQKNALVQMIQSVVEEYFVYSEDYVVTSDNPDITIPDVASGLRLRDVYVLDKNSDQGGEIKYQLPRRQLDQLGDNAAFYTWGADRTGSYYLQNNKLKLYPKPHSEKFIRIFYYRMPNELVLPSAGITVGKCNIAGGFEACGSVPSYWATDLGKNYLFDVIEPTLPYNTKGTIQVNGISDSVFYVNDPDQLALVQPGDYVYYRGEAPVIQYMPQEAFYVLASATAVYLMKSVGDSQGMKECQLQYELDKKTLLGLVTPRTVGNPKKIINRNSVFNSARITWPIVVR